MEPDNCLLYRLLSGTLEVYQGPSGSLRVLQTPAPARPRGRKHGAIAPALQNQSPARSETERQRWQRLLVSGKDIRKKSEGVITGEPLGNCCRDPARDELLFCYRLAAFRNRARVSSIDRWRYALGDLKPYLFSLQCHVITCLISTVFWLGETLRPPPPPGMRTHSPSSQHLTLRSNGTRHGVQDVACLRMGNGF